MKRLHKIEIERYILNHDRLSYLMPIINDIPGGGVMYLKLFGCSYKDIFKIFFVTYYLNTFNVFDSSGSDYFLTPYYIIYLLDYFDGDIRRVDYMKDSTLGMARIYFNDTKCVWIALLEG